MSTSPQQQNDWPSALVALGILILIGAIAISAIVHYNTVDDALKIWSGLTALVGVITGAFVSYFFTRGTTQAAQQTAQVAQQSAQTSNQAAQQAAQTAQDAQKKVEEKSKALTAALALITDPQLRDEVMNNAAVAEALSPK